MYLRHSTYYFFHFAALGALLPYWGLYLQDRGFGAREIGELVAIMLATRIVAPLAWGWLADASGRRMAIVRAASFLALVCFAGTFFPGGYGWVALVMAAYSFSWNAALPQFEAVTLSRLGSETHLYSSIRLWGSIGFVVTVVMVAPLLDRCGAAFLPVILTGIFLGLGAVSLAIDEPPSAPGPRPPADPFWAVLRRPPVLALLAVCLLMQASHGPYYAFFSIGLEAADYPGWLIGPLWALGVLAEIGIFMAMHRLQPHYGPRRLLLASVGLTILRWMMIGLGIEHLAVVLVAQLLHAASFGVYHAVAITLIHDAFRAGHQGRGQALYTSVSYGAGGALGALFAGNLWAWAGAPAAFLTGAAASALAWCIAWRWVA